MYVYTYMHTFACVIVKFHYGTEREINDVTGCALTS